MTYDKESIGANLWRVSLRISDKCDGRASALLSPPSAKGADALTCAVLRLLFRIGCAAAASPTDAHLENDLYTRTYFPLRDAGILVRVQERGCDLPF